MPVKLFLDFLSQPSRALYMFFKVTNVPFELQTVSLGSGEHLTKEFKRDFSQFQKVPFIHDENFRLAESIAIVRYVATKYGITSNWYPTDLTKRAKVDEFLEWQHHNLREYGVLYFRKKWMFPSLFGLEVDPKEIAKIEKNLIKTIDNFEEFWLRNSPFIAGEKISVADLFAASELQQPRVAGFNPMDGRPVLTSWLDRVKQETGPSIYDEAHQDLEKLIASTATTKNKL